MKFWNNIIKTAMLGTNKKEIGEDDLPEDMLVAMKTIEANGVIDTEEKFLQTAALAFNYRQSGVVPNYQPEPHLPSAPPEEKKYCNENAVQALRDILFEESTGLLKMWLLLCVQKEQIIIPYLIPTLLNISVQHKQLKLLVQECIGNRGRWLSRFNNEWSFAKEASIEELWQTGTPGERKNVLQQLRIADSAKAREWLKQTWTVENANTKNDFLATLPVNLSGDDVEWLESLVNEKSQKVKEHIIVLLKQIASSDIVKKYEELLRVSVAIKKEKGLLGLSSKNVLHFKLPEIIDESIFKSGIEKLSNIKEFSDDEFILYQVIQFVPPAFWEQQFSLTPSETIHFFQKDDTRKKFIPALVTAASQFKDAKWASAFVQELQIFYPSIVPLLPLDQQEFYCNKFFSGSEESIISYATQRDEEWGAELAKNILRYTAKNYYTYNRSFYNQHIHLVPVQLVGVLEKCTPQEEHLRDAWTKTSEYIIKLITLKIQTIKAFQ